MEISERKKDVIKLLSSKILGNIKYHLTSHWIETVMWLFKIKKFKLKKKNFFYEISSGNKYFIKLNYDGSNLFVNSRAKSTSSITTSM